MGKMSPISPPTLTLSFLINIPPAAVSLLDVSQDLDDLVLGHPRDVQQSVLILKPISVSFFYPFFLDGRTLVFCI